MGAFVGIAYFFLTKHTREGNFRDLRSVRRPRPLGEGRGEGERPRRKAPSPIPLPKGEGFKGMLLEACSDPRVWALFIAYGCCFGIEITIENIIVLYLLDYFDYFRHIDHGQALKIAGLLASLFGLMNLFARPAGGWIGDQCGHRWGLSGRVKWLFVALFCEGIAMLFFSKATTLMRAIPLLVLFALFVKMSNGATYAVVPFVNRRALGVVSGIVGAGGNAGAVLAGFLLKTDGLDWHTALFILGAVITVCSFLILTVKLCEEDEPLRYVQSRNELAVGATDPVGAVA
jgi:NNP family nitrate/nitrite transporter-like MFS transporter